MIWTFRAILVRMQAHPSHEALRRGGLVNFISGRGFPSAFCASWNAVL